MMDLLFLKQDYKLAPPSPIASPSQPSLISIDEFRCLEDTPKLWKERRAIRDAHRDRYCNQSAAAARMATTVPIVFVFWVANRGMLTDDNFHMLSLALNTAAKFNDRVLLLLFGRRADMQFEVLPNVEIRQVVMDESDPLYVALKSFDQPLYNHMSVNTVEYELYCFQRWFALQRLMELERMEHVFVADNDVLVLTNVTADVEQCYSSCDTAGAFVYSAYFTRQVLQNFTQYILDVYRDKASSERLQAIRKKYYVVSDMMLHLEFNLKTRNGSACINYKAASQQGLVPEFPYMGHFYDFQFDQDQAGLVTLHSPGYSPRLAPVLHFQGGRKKHMTKCEYMSQPKAFSSPLQQLFG